MPAKVSPNPRREIHRRGTRNVRDANWSLKIRMVNSLGVLALSVKVMAPCFQNVTLKKYPQLILLSIEAGLGPKREVMKLILLNPYFDATHAVVKALKAKDIAVLLAADSGEAWQLLQLHGKSVDLAVVHIEDRNEAGDAGLDFIMHFKGESDFSDLPFVLTTSRWTDEQCASHQEGPLGAHAYLKYPFSAEQLLQVIEGVAGVPETTAPVRIPTPPPPPIRNTQLDVREISIEGEGSVELDMEPSPFPSRPEALTAEDAPSLETPPPVPRQFSKPMGDAVVPGGAAQSPDIETLKYYLELREQDVAALSKELGAMKDRIQSLSQESDQEKYRNEELVHQVRELNDQLKTRDHELASQQALREKEALDLQFEIRQKNDKIRGFEHKIKDANEEIEKIKERVRLDIRKIRVKEKELQNKLEVLRKDSEVLIHTREQRIIELKRRLDLVEFNLDLVQDQHLREKEKNKEMQKKLNRASQAMKVAGGMLETDSENGPGPDSKKAS